MKKSGNRLIRCPDFVIHYKRGGYVLTTVLVSRAFYISQGRARDVLHYIRHEGRSRISSEQVPLQNNTHPFSKGLRVQSVNLTSVVLQEKENCSRTVTVRTPPPTWLSRDGDIRESVRLLRQWMIARRPGEAVPEVLLVTARAD